MATIITTALIAVGSSAGTAATVGSVATGVLGAVSAVSTIAGGIQQQQAGEFAAHQAYNQSRTEELAMRQDAIQVNEELMMTLSRNTVNAAASGMQSSGSVARAQEQTKRNAAVELSTQQFNSRSKQDALKAQASNATSRGNAGLVTSLFDVAETGYGTYNKIRKTK